MAASDLPLLLEAVGQLDVELACLSDIVSAHGDRLPVAAGMNVAVDRASRSLHAIRDRVLESTSALTIDRFESSVRARGIVVQSQLRILERAEPEIGHRLWPVGRFGTLSDVGSFLLDRIGRVNTTWLEDRRDLELEEDRGTHRRLIAAVAKAERSLISIGKDHDVIVFLALGASFVSLRFRTASRVLAALLDIPLAPVTPRTVRGTAITARLAPRAPGASVSVVKDEER